MYLNFLLSDFFTDFFSIPRINFTLVKNCNSLDALREGVGGQFVQLYCTCRGQP